MTYSTGCQDAVTLLRTAPPPVRAKIRAAVLQAPVSDRESDSLETEPETRAALLASAQRFIAEGNGSALMPGFLHNGFVPISAAG